MKNARDKRVIQNVISVIVVVLSAIMLLRYGNQFVLEDQYNKTFMFYLIILSVAIVVHALKAVRLFIILLGQPFDKKIFLFCFIDTTIVNLLLPFKSGEVYRGYRIGELVGSYSIGYIMVIFDRFVDTLALIAFIVGAGFIEGFEITSLYIVLAIFLLICILIYWMFKPLYQYWNHFLVFKRGTKHTLWGLKILNLCNETYKNIQAVVKGRFAIIFGISLAAWGIEIFGMMSLTRYIDTFGMADYLTDIMRGELSVQSMAFALISVVFLGIVKLVIRLMQMSAREKG